MSQLKPTIFENVAQYESYIKNCTIKMKPDEKGPLFFQEKNRCGILARLDGYAIVPNEEYEDLLKRKK